MIPRRFDNAFKLWGPTPMMGWQRKDDSPSAITKKDAEILKKIQYGFDKPIGVRYVSKKN